MDVAQLRGFAECLSSSRRVLLDLAGLEPGAVFPPPAARVVLNLLLLAAESLPGGGIVALSGSPAHSILMTISGPRAAWPAGLATWLNDETAASEAMLADRTPPARAAGRAARPWPRLSAVDADAGRPDGRRRGPAAAAAVASRRIAPQLFTYCS